MRDIVLLPGFMCDETLWDDMRPGLDVLGNLHFGDVYADDTLEGMARRVLAAAPPRFVLVGFSMGGFVARVVALMEPDRVAGIAFVASSARAYTDAETAGKRHRMAVARAPAQRGSALSLHPDRDRDPVLVGRLKTMARRLGPEIQTRQLALVRRDGYADLGRIACPALVVACSHDRARSLDETRKMAEHLPDARFELLADCGHMAPLERPAELTAILADWIAGAGL